MRIINSYLQNGSVTKKRYRLQPRRDNAHMKWDAGAKSVSTLDIAKLKRCVLLKDATSDGGVIHKEITKQ